MVQLWIRNFKKNAKSWLTTKQKVYKFIHNLGNKKQNYKKYDFLTYYANKNLKFP